jgi:RHS repeat-associated protein
MEAAYRSTESQIFANIAATSYPWSSVPGSGSIPSGTKLAYTNPNDSVAKVDYNGTTGQTTGPSLLLKVMAGDTVQIGTQCYYNTGSGSTNNSSFSAVLNSLANGLVNMTGGAHGTVANLTASNSTVYTGLSSFLSTDDPAPSGYPKAYINWVFLDDQFNYVASLSGAIQAASSTYPAGQLNTVAQGSQMALTRNGYLYIWVSNETQGWDVFFDNFGVQYKQGPVLEENHYYPFGLTMAGISDEAIKANYAENRYRFNKGSELQHKEFSDGSGLEMYDAHARAFDPQLGRFSQIDPIANEDNQESLTPYQFGTDDPIRYNDPSGKCPSCILGAVIGAIVDAGAQVVEGTLEGKSLGDAISDINFKEVAVAAVAGFVTSGVSAIYQDAAVAGTDLALSKGAAGVLASATVSVLNQSNDAASKGEALNISPIKMVQDIATDKLSDHLAQKTPEIKINGAPATNLNETTKTAVSDGISKGVDLGKDMSNSSASGKSSSTIPSAVIIKKPDAAAVKRDLPLPLKLKQN